MPPLLSTPSCNTVAYYRPPDADPLIGGVTPRARTSQVCMLRATFSVAMPLATKYGTTCLRARAFTVGAGKRRIIGYVLPFVRSRCGELGTVRIVLWLDTAAYYVSVLPGSPLTFAKLTMLADLLIM